MILTLLRGAKDWKPTFIYTGPCHPGFLNAILPESLRLSLCLNQPSWVRQILPEALIISFQFQRPLLASTLNLLAKALRTLRTTNILSQSPED